MRTLSFFVQALNGKVIGSGSRRSAFFAVVLPARAAVDDLLASLVATRRRLYLQTCLRDRERAQYNA